jgi:hypothetical protein
MLSQCGMSGEFDRSLVFPVDIMIPGYGVRVNSSRYQPLS